MKTLRINDADNCISHIRPIICRVSWRKDAFLMDPEGSVLPQGMSISDERERRENDKQKERDRGRERGTRKLLRWRGEREGRNEVPAMAEGNRGVRRKAQEAAYDRRISIF